MTFLPPLTPNHHSDGRIAIEVTDFSHGEDNYTRRRSAGEDRKESQSTNDTGRSGRSGYNPALGIRESG